MEVVGLFQFVAGRIVGELTAVGGLIADSLIADSLSVRDTVGRLYSASLCRFPTTKFHV